MQDYLLTPESYTYPVKPSKKDITCPIFLQIYQKTYSYIQIVRVETNEDIIGINLVPKNKVEIFTKYQDSFVIATPGSDEILKTGDPVCDVTLQLAANVLTQKRHYKTLLNAMEEVGGLMEFFYEFFRIILSYIVNEAYEKSLVNGLFSFDIESKKIIFKNNEDKNKDYGKKNDKKKINFIDDKKYGKKFIISKSVNNNTTKKEDITNIDKISLSESFNREKTCEKFELFRENIKTRKYEKIENINKKCIFIRNKKKNLEKICFEEGMKLITKNLDISKLFNNSYIVEKNKDKLTIDSSMSISEENSKYIDIILEKNNKKDHKLNSFNL